ncbi:GLPGLI family protein [Ferruginibacter yonginensis]|uniref:GLPGLI family protein n=1 Tax=Ferruginibacter yonginensis TaxID=1310416 RepID=A0ABV8QN93_9BACT
MKLYILFTILISSFVFASNAQQQQFIDKAMVEYEVKTNIKKTMGNDSWAEMMKENLPTFKISYYQYTFANNQSIYKFNRWDEKSKLPEYMRRDDEANNWFFDFNKNKLITQKNIFGSTFNIEDTIPTINWVLTNESRNIAGFNCRKAVGKIFDSVYVFAFYTDEIMVSGGPCSINGLPGLIMGVTIPRLFTSFIATKVSINGVAFNDIKPTTAKKYYNNAFIKNTIFERTKDWWDGGDDKEEAQQQKNRFVWSLML